MLFFADVFVQYKVPKQMYQNLYEIRLLCLISFTKFVFNHSGF